MILRNIDVQTSAIQPKVQNTGVKESANPAVQTEEKISDNKKGSQALSSYFRGEIGRASCRERV